jgi:chromosome segregation ATPase
MLEKLAQVKRDRDQAMADAANRDWTLRSQLGEERHRADELAKEVEGLKDRAARLEADLSAGSAALAEAQGRAARLDEGLRAVVDREVKQSREWELARADLSERIERLEAARLNAEKAHQEVLALKDQGERALLSLQAQSEGLVRKLTEAESGRDAALAKAARQEQVHQEVNRADRDELKRRVEDLQNERSELADRIARLERAAVVAENMQADLRSQKAESERALSTARAELETLIRKLADAETDRDRARAKIAKSEEALRAAFEEEKLQAEQKLQTALKDREEQLSGEWVVSRSDLSNRIARLEAAAVAAENAHQELLDQKAESERALAEVRAEAEGLARKLAAAESDRDRARAEVAKSEEVVLAAFQEQRQRTEEFERHEAELKDRLSGQFVVSRTELSDRISRLEAAAAAEEDTRKQLLAEKAQLEQSLDSFRSDNLELARKLAAAVQERDRFQAAAQAGTGLEAVLGATGGEGSALQGAESEAGSAAFEAERQTLVARLAEAQEQRDQALAEAARRDAARQAEIAAQRQRAAELESRIAVAIEREAKQSAAWSAAQAEWSARVARLEADEVIADRARTELVNRKKESDRVLAALQAQKEALARRLDAVEKARDQARATVAKYEEAHEELIVSGASLEHWRARFKRTLPEAEGHSSRNTGPLSTLVKGWATAATQGPYRRRLSADQPSTEAGESDIDHTGVLDEIAASASPNPPATTAPVEPSPGETEPEPPPLTVRPSSIERLRPSPPAGQGAPKKDDEADRSGRWLSGLANRIRRGPKDPE